jgi:hypothetical protein
MANAEWVDELPGKSYEELSQQRNHYRPRDQSKDLYEHAALLIGHPMRWAKYPRPLATAYSARRMSDAIREGTLAAFDPKLGFQSASRDGVCYVRYNPEAIDPHKVAFREGYESGRRDAMREVAGAVWEFRQWVSSIEGWNVNGNRPE